MTTSDTDSRSLVVDLSRPMRDLLLQLPLLEVTPAAEIDFPATDAALLLQLCDNAERSMDTILNGLAAVGHLLATAAPEVETRSIPGDVIESLGWLMAELGDFAATAHCLTAAGRRYLSDYAPETKKHVPNVKV